MADALFVGLAFADVVRDDDEVRDLVAVRTDGVDHGPQREGLAGVAPQPQFAVPGAARDGGAPDVLEMRVGLAIRTQAFGRLPGDFLETVASTARERTVDRDNAPFAVGDHDALGGRLENLGPQRQALLHRLEAVDRCECGEYGILRLIAQPASGEQSPVLALASLPQDLEFVRRAPVGELLEEAGARRRAESRQPGVGASTFQPVLRRDVAVQDFMLRNRGDDERNRYRFEQLALGDRRTLAGSHLLFDESALIQLLQHAVEAIHQPPEFIARIPVGAQLIVASGTDPVGDIGEPANRQRDLARDKIDDAQD